MPQPRQTREGLEPTSVIHRRVYTYIFHVYAIVGAGEPHLSAMCFKTSLWRGLHASAMHTFHRRGPYTVGSQAFYKASVFNTTIGAWNTACVTTLYEVCSFRPLRVTRRGCNAAQTCARSGSDATWPVCAATPPMLVRACAGHPR
jgi:hypothetical protein